MDRIWIVRYWDNYTGSLNIDRIFTNEEAAKDYMNSGFNPGRYFEIESWKTYSNWPEQSKALKRWLADGWLEQDFEEKGMLYRLESHGGNDE